MMELQEAYLLTLYVTVEQENFIRQSFRDNGWPFLKGPQVVLEDLSGDIKQEQKVTPHDIDMMTNEGMSMLLPHVTQVAQMSDMFHNHTEMELSQGHETIVIQLVPEDEGESAKPNVSVVEISQSLPKKGLALPTEPSGGSSSNTGQDTKPVQRRAIVVNLEDEQHAEEKKTVGTKQLGVTTRKQTSPKKPLLTQKPSTQSSVEKQLAVATRKSAALSQTPASPIIKSEGASPKHGSLPQTGSDQSTAKAVAVRGKALAEGKTSIGKSTGSATPGSAMSDPAASGSTTPSLSQDDSIAEALDEPSEPDQDLESLASSDARFLDAYNAELSKKSLQSPRMRTRSGAGTQMKCNICSLEFYNLDDWKDHMITHAPEKFHVCSFCNEVFQNEAKLKRHKMIHVSSKIRFCEECGKDFTSPKALDIHMTAMHASEAEKEEARRKHMCKDCGKTFAEAKYLSRHEKMVHSDIKPFTCKQCDKAFHRAGKLEQHMRVHTGETPYTCHFCLKGFRESIFLRRHLRIHTGERPFACKICNKAFSERSNMVKHKLTHSNVQAYSCDQCDRTFKRKDSLRIHKRKHAGETPYICDVCGRGCISSSALHKHKEIHLRPPKPRAAKFPKVISLDKEKLNEERGKVFKCPDCPKKFRLKKYLEEHSRMHSGYRPYVCDVCSSSFTTNSTLRKHKKLHEQGQMHMCGTCGKEFTQAVYLRNHMIQHTGEKKYVCEVCNRGFLWYASLTKHQKTHTGDREDESVRPFSCMDCGKRFKQEKYLKDHMMLHTDNRPFKCDHCDKQYVTKSSLRQHVKIHDIDPMVRYGCAYCNKIFKTVQLLVQHQSTHTQVQVRATTTQYQCQECKELFSTMQLLEKHMEVHMSETVVEEQEIEMIVVERPIEQVTIG